MYKEARYQTHLYTCPFRNMRPNTPSWAASYDGCSVTYGDDQSAHTPYLHVHVRTADDMIVSRSGSPCFIPLLVGLLPVSSFTPNNRHMHRPDAWMDGHSTDQ
jgi:hypothetical protein